MREEGAFSPAKLPSFASVSAALYKGLLFEIKRQPRQKLACWGEPWEGQGSYVRFRVIVKFTVGQLTAPQAPSSAFVPSRREDMKLRRPPSEMAF